MLTIVYTKCDANDRLELWDHIYNLINNMSLHWLVGDDFNVSLCNKENIGGLRVYPQEYEVMLFVLTHNLISILKVVHLFCGMGE